MKKLLLIATLFCIMFLAILCKPTDTDDSSSMPPPTERTIVKMDGEDRPKRTAREKWLDLMHKTADGEDWKEIEYQNNIKSARYKQQLRAELGSRNPQDGETVADGNLRGTWRERGSDNNAGSMITVNYTPEADLYFGLSAGGTLWKGDRVEQTWEVVNQDFRFGGDLVEARYMPSGDIRYIAQLNRHPVYSDDGGATWMQSAGIETSQSAKMKDFVEDDNGNIYFLHKANNIQFVSVVRSSDNGASFDKIFTFSGRNEIDYNLVKVGGANDLIVIEQKDADLTRVHMWNEATGVFDIVEENSPIGFGSGNDRANLNAVFDGDSLRLFVLSPQTVDVGGQEQEQMHLYTSTDLGTNWSMLSALPTIPWDVGLFVSPTDYTKMMYGEVNPYRSSNGGKFWSKVSNWWEYYDDIFTKLHADIMDIKEFTDPYGEPFTVVCNHGGISESYDRGSTYSNVGLFTLNISQYYSVATHPTQREWVFAGAQDQGFQRGKINGDGSASLDQVISGDYGHIVFSGQNDNMWTVYPWGSVSYYANPLLQGPTTWYELVSDDETVWIPPLLGHPDKSQNAIFMAGGNVDGGSGSHMIRLDMTPAGEIVPSQFDYDFLQTGGGPVSAMGISPLDHDLIFVASTGGHIFKSTDGGNTFERKQTGLPNDHYLYGSCIKPSAIDVNVVYVSGNAYSSAGVYKSTDGGESYFRLDNGLPQTMVFCLAPNEDESLIYAATEAGPYVYIASQDQWHELSGVGTPNQTYWSVEYLPETQTARFGTYGRGIWDFEFEEVVTSVDDGDFADGFEIKVYPNPTADFITIEHELDQKYDLTIADQTGIIAFGESSINEKQKTIDLSTIPRGIYYLTVTTEGKSLTKKIIKK